MVSMIHSILVPPFRGLREAVGVVSNLIFY